LGHVPRWRGGRGGGSKHPGLTTKKERRLKKWCAVLKLPTFKGGTTSRSRNGHWGGTQKKGPTKNEPYLDQTTRAEAAASTKNWETKIESLLKKSHNKQLSLKKSRGRTSEFRRD